MVAAIIVAFVVLLSAAYVPLFLLVADVHPRVFGFPGGACASSLVFAAMGYLIARRYPSNPVGWIMLAVAVLAIVLADAGVYALLVYRGGHANLPLGPVAAWLGTTLWSAALSLLAVGMLLFPDGRIRSRGWRAVLWVCVAVDAAFVCALGLFALTIIVGAPVSIGLDGQLSAMTNVDGVSGHPFGSAFLALFPFLLATLVVAAAGLISNTRHSHGERRQQLKWFMYAAALSAIGLGVYEVSVFTMGPSAALAQAGSFMVILGICAIPVSAAVAVFKYHLYDIDVVISRTLVYGSLAALITGVYVAIAVGIGALIGGGGRPNLALSILATAIVAVGFQPIRARLQHVVNRLVYGKRATPYEVLSRFPARSLRRTLLTKCCRAWPRRSARALAQRRRQCGSEPARNCAPWRRPLLRRMIYVPWRSTVGSCRRSPAPIPVHRYCTRAISSVH